MQIREAEFTDYTQIAQLHASNWQQVYAGILDDDYLQNQLLDERKAIWQTRLTHPSLNQGILLIEQDDQLCGFVCLYGNHSFELGTMIDNLHVAKDYRGKGIGKQLLAEAATWANKHFSDIGLYLEVIEKNYAAKGFYHSIGGTHAGDPMWNAPDGSQVPCQTYTWASPKHLQQFV
ncbi:GNAT family N-acetyltransferase [Vibrio sp. S11_S32]|uniref:GNAT family N-acetyltransferase n=1 Tax=Vibrio sp. S11_S32 TaxID=2720225 RepID=UPI001680A18C|nr:GNAT family N-acetyltransferase [Vibrio sp. S11_S32]MBD1577762.1 GNAT family N-acetyltransferase [Vibrio sp. S11_S32]